MTTAKSQAKPKSKKPAMLLSATSMAALLTACGGDDGGSTPTSANILGTARQGETLSVNVPDAPATGVTYQWQSDGANITGATDGTYLLNQYDLGKIITITASYTDGEGTTQSLTSAPTTPITIGPAFALANLITNSGFKIEGVIADDYLGYSVSSAGDVNGDGYDDLVIGAYRANPNGNSDAGSSYVVYGGAGLVDIDLQELLTSQGFKIDGVAMNDNSGVSVSSAGDVNGDGFDDVIIGAWTADTNGIDNGASYVVYGGLGILDVDLSALPMAQGFRIDGAAAGDHSGLSVASAGDVNGDGYDDIIIGASQADPNGNVSSGSSYIVYGGAALSDVDLSSLPLAQGFRIDGESVADHAGVSVSSAGDVNGDGYDDLIIGASGVDFDADTDVGTSYIVYGGATGANVDLSTLPSAQGFRIDGIAAFDSSGYSVASAGDVNADGYDDVIIGARSADSNGLISGSSYVVYGSLTGANVDLSTLVPTQGFAIHGAASGDLSGFSVSSAGDVNGDGYDDILIGASEANTNGILDTGVSYVIFGGETLTDMNLSSLDGTNGFRINGVAANDRAGTSVSSAGDVNADGYDDLIIGAHLTDIDGNSNVGSSYIIYGAAHFTETTMVANENEDVALGDGGNNTLNTGAGEDVLIGGLGEDILTGGTDADQMWGGGNLDTFAFAAGDSQLTITGSTNQGQISGYDVIHDFEIANTNFMSETIDLADGFSIVGNGSTDGENSSLEVGIEGSIQSHSIFTGVISFDNAEIYDQALDIFTQGSLAASVQYLQLQDFGDAGATVAFDYGADTFIFSQGDDLGTNDLDILIKLEATQVENLITTNTTTTDFDLLIA